MSLRKTIQIHPGYDRRASGGGVHGAEIVFVLQGKHGAVTLALQTAWIPQPLQIEADRKAHSTVIQTGLEPKPMEYTFHFDQPLYTSLQLQRTVCPYMPEGSECYSMRDSKLALELRDILLASGSEGVWNRLAKEYNNAVRIMGESQEQDV